MTAPGMPSGHRSDSRDRPRHQPPRRQPRRPPRRRRPRRRRPSRADREAQVVPAPASVWATARWRALGTTALVHAPAEQITAARRAVEAELEAIDSAASRFRPESELSRLNRATGRWTSVSPLLLQALALGIRAAVVTGGAVDPTLGGELHELGYDRDYARLAQIPATRPLRHAVDPDPQGRRSRWAEIELRDRPTERPRTGRHSDRPRCDRKGARGRPGSDCGAHGDRVGRARIARRRHLDRRG